MRRLELIKIIIESNKGFSLLEALMSVLLVAILVMGVIGLTTMFTKYTRDDLISTCLLQAASSGIEAKRADPSRDSIVINCGGLSVNVTITGNPPPQPPTLGSGQSACAEITATASVSGRTMVLRDLVCNFPQG